MNHAEVIRLRRLRRAALRARVVARGLDAVRGSNDSVLTATALACWGIARLVTGHLRSHPNLSYQREPSPMRDLLDRLSGLGVGLLSRPRGARVLERHLQFVARKLDDAKVLTRSQQLSDALARMQSRLQRLRGQPAAAHLPMRPRGQIELASNWPYMAM